MWPYCFNKTLLNLDGWVSAKSGLCPTDRILTVSHLARDPFASTLDAQKHAIPLRESSDLGEKVARGLGKTDPHGLVGKRVSLNCRGVGRGTPQAPSRERSWAISSPRAAADNLGFPRDVNQYAADCA